MNVIGTGLYSLRQAARLVGADARAVRRWMQGYEHSFRGERRFSPPLWRTQLIEVEFAEPTIGFQDLLELRLVNVFVKHGVSLAVIKATANAAHEQFGADYPLTTRQFLTDGERFFGEAIHRSGEERVVDVLRRKHVFSNIIKPSLYAGIEYDAHKNAKRWFPLGNDRRAIVLDPARQFGMPIVSGASIPTDTLYAAYLAEGRDRRLVGRIFGISPQTVDAAVRFEESFGA